MNDGGVNRRQVLAIAGTAGIGAVAGCLGELLGDDDDVEIEDEVTVSVGPDNRDDFDPQIAHVEVGGTVTWEWSSGNHDVTSFHPANDLPNRAPDGTSAFSGDISGPGDTMEVDFDQEGVWDVVCVRHNDVGMAMKVVAGFPDLDNEPAMEELTEGASATQDRINSLNDEVRELIDG